MLLKIFLFSSAFVVASANNVIPAQTYPIYQQNGYMNPEQTSQPVNIQSYDPSATNQNQLQQWNISPSSIKQAILNRLLTGQPMQAIFDPNTMGYNPVLNGVQNNYIPANLANNYIALPGDYLKSSTSNTNIDTVANNSTNKVKKNKKKSKSRRPNNAMKVENPSNQNKHAELSYRSSNNTENVSANNKNTKRKTRKLKSQVTKPEEDKSNIANNKTEGRKKKQKDVASVNPIKEENEIQNTKSHKHRNKQRFNETSGQNKPKQIQNIDLDIINEGINNENRLARNPKQVTIDQQKFMPQTTNYNKPIEVPYNFMSNFNQFNNPMMGNWFANIYKSMGNQPPVNQIKPKRRRKSKRTRKSKRKHITSKNIPEEAIVKTTNDSTTTEIIVHMNENITDTMFCSNSTEESPKSIETDLSSNEIFRDGNDINEFGDKFDTGYYGGYIDDYYPIFTDNAAYNANNKEIILKNLNDNKYYYTTDVIDTDITRQNLRDDHVLPERDLVNYEKNKHTYDNTEKESIRKAYEKGFDGKFEENLQFRSPPFLESPDFTTKEIDRKAWKPEVYYVSDKNVNSISEDKSSTYSIAKIPHKIGAKGKNEIKKKAEDVETVYAKSKVVSYGTVYIPDEELEDEDISSAASNQVHWPDHSFTGESYKSGDTTYVIAKSLDHPYWQRR